MKLTLGKIAEWTHGKIDDIVTGKDISAHRQQPVKANEKPSSANASAMEELGPETGGAYGVFTSMFWDKDRKFGVIAMTNGCNERRDHHFMSIHRECAQALYNNIINPQK